MSLHFILWDMVFFFLNVGLILEKWQWNDCYLKARDPDYGHTCTLEQASLWHVSWEKLLEVKV